MARKSSAPGPWSRATCSHGGGWGKIDDCSTWANERTWRTPPSWTSQREDVNHSHIILDVAYIYFFGVLHLIGYPCYANWHYICVYTNIYTLYLYYMRPNLPLRSLISTVYGLICKFVRLTSGSLRVCYCLGWTSRSWVVLQTVSGSVDNLEIFSNYVAATALRSIDLIRFDVGVSIECLRCILDFCFESYS